MNLKSGLFKFLIIMLFLMLIPVATAIDYDDTVLDDSSHETYSQIDSDNLEDVISKQDEVCVDATQDSALKATDDSNSINGPLKAGKNDVESGADLVLVKTTKVNKAKKGDVIIWTIKVTNRGPDRAENVYVTDRVAGDVEFFNYFASRGDFDPMEGIWAIGGLDAGESVYLKIYAKMLSSTPTVNNATADSDTEDPDLDNNFDTSSVDCEKPSHDRHNNLEKHANAKMHATGNPVIFLLLAMISLCTFMFRKH